MAARGKFSRHGVAEADAMARLSSVEFSQDSSLIAAGSPESCIRLWSLKGEKLKAKSVGALIH